MKKFNLFKMLAVLIVLITSINTAWGADVGIYLNGNFTGNNWDKATYQFSWVYNSQGDKVYQDVYATGSAQYFRFWTNNSCEAPSDNKEMNCDGIGCTFTTNGGKKNAKYIGNAGIIRICVDQSGDKDYNPWVWIERPTIMFKYGWNGAEDWTEQSATSDNQDGSYYYKGQYGSGNAFNAGPQYDLKYATATKHGSISSGDYCMFVWDASGYQHATGETNNTGTFGIYQLHTISYNGNGKTTGDVPSNTDALHNRASVLATNSGSLAKNHYIFTGWNTQADGNGTHYDAGGSITATSDVELFAEWEPVWAIKGSDSYDPDGDEDEMGDWAVFNGLKYNESTSTYIGTITLAAHTAYYFKVYDRGNSAYWGVGTRNNDYTYIGQTDNVNIGTSPGYNALLLTTQGGTYTFEWSGASHNLKITYPNAISHPSLDYTYMEKYSGWNSGSYCHIHYFYDDGGAGETMTTWGSDNPKMTAYATINGTNYYCFPILTTYPNYIAKHNLGDTELGSGKETGKMYTSGHAGQLTYYKDASDGWVFKSFQFTVTLTDQVTTTKASTNQTVDFNGAVPSDIAAANLPTCAYYTFGGYFTQAGGEGNQVITAAGAWKESVPGYTDGSKKWIHEGGTATLYAKWTQNVTLNANHEGAFYNGSMTATYNNASVEGISAPMLASCEVVGYYAEPACTNLIMDADGTLHNYTGYVSGGKWTRDAATTLYAKWRSTNFVIYRPGDKDEDNRSIDDQVETYAGGTIAKTIEYRMKVRQKDTWYALSIPFTVNEVKVWDDAGWHDIFPYYRPDVGGTYYQGYYVLRTPRTSTELPISDFSDWRDPTDYTYKPENSKPYIILWHHGYFEGKYVSFFGASGQTIPNAMTVGTAPTADGVLNIYGNDAMTSGSVQDGYTYVGDYGGGAWLRNETKGTNRTVPAFECYILANGATTESHLVIKRRTGEDSATGWDDVLNSEYKEVITVYTISGLRVAQYHDCSIAEAGRRMNAELSEGIYILSAGNESVKIMIGGK